MLSSNKPPTNALDEILSDLDPHKIPALYNLGIISGYKTLRSYAQDKPLTFLTGNWPKELVNMSRLVLSDLMKEEITDINQVINYTGDLDTLKILFNNGLMLDSLNLSWKLLDILPPWIGHLRNLRYLLINCKVSLLQLVN